MHTYVRNVARFNPFVLSEELVKKTILFQSKISTIANDIYILIGYSAALFIIIILIQSFARKHILFSIERHKRKKEGK